MKHTYTGVGLEQYRQICERELPVSELKTVWKGVAVLIGEPHGADGWLLGVTLQLAGLAVVIGCVVYHFAQYAITAPN